MADQRGGGIAWSDETWNCLRGCTRVSEGCRFCYAEVIAARFSGPGQPYEGLAKRTPAGPRWTGKIALVENHVHDPLYWTRPRKVFVNSMSDVFHEGVKDEWLDLMFAVMALAPQHTFQILTKRPERMLSYLSAQVGPVRDDLKGTAWVSRVARDVAWLLHDSGKWPSHHGRWGEVTELHRELLKGNAWPLPNVWLGISVEDQETADERIQLLLQVPAAVRWISYEPALGPVDFGFDRWVRLPAAVRSEVPFIDKIVSPGVYRAEANAHGALSINGLGIKPAEFERVLPNWVVVGGESGHSARPFDVHWARQTIQQCRAAGVAVFVKQLGSNPTTDHRTRPKGEEPYWTQLLDRKADEPSRWPLDLRVREFPR